MSKTDSIFKSDDPFASSQTTNKRSKATSGKSNSQE